MSSDEVGQYADGNGPAMVMPFVTTISHGGPHEDQSYVAGYEMGLLDAGLRDGVGKTFRTTIRTDNLPQADLLGMRYGWMMTKIETTAPEWTFVSFYKEDNPL